MRIILALILWISMFARGCVALSPGELARKIDNALSLNFSGQQVIVYFQPPASPKTRVYKVVQRGPVFFRWEELTDAGPGLIVIRDHEYLSQGYPGFQYVLRQPFSEEIFLRIPGITQAVVKRAKQELAHSKITKGEYQVLCGRQTRRYDLTLPKGGHYRIWLDKTTGLIMREERLDPKGELNYRMFYTELALARDFAPETYGFHWKPAPIVLTDPVDWHRRFLNWRFSPQLGIMLPWPTYLPPGYHFEGATLLPSRRGKRNLYLRFRRDEQLLSLFIRPGKSLRSFPKQPKATKRGPLTIINWQGAEAQLTLIGRGNEAELLRVAESIK